MNVLCSNRGVESTYACDRTVVCSITAAFFLVFLISNITRQLLTATLFTLLYRQYKNLHITTVLAPAQSRLLSGALDDHSIGFLSFLQRILWKHTWLMRLQINQARKSIIYTIEAVMLSQSPTRWAVCFCLCLIMRGGPCLLWVRIIFRGTRSSSLQSQT